MNSISQVNVSRTSTSFKLSFVVNTLDKQITYSYGVSGMTSSNLINADADFVGITCHNFDLLNTDRFSSARLEFRVLKDGDVENRVYSLVINLKSGNVATIGFVFYNTIDNSGSYLVEYITGNRRQTLIV